MAKCNCSFLSPSFFIFLFQNCFLENDCLIPLDPSVTFFVRNLPPIFAFSVYLVLQNIVWDILIWKNFVHCLPIINTQMRFGGVNDSLPGNVPNVQNPFSHPLSALSPLPSHTFPHPQITVFHLRA